MGKDIVFKRTSAALLLLALLAAPTRSNAVGKRPSDHSGSPRCELFLLLDSETPVLKHPVSRQLIDSYIRFALVSGSGGIRNLPPALLPSMMNYILDDATLGRQARLTVLFEQAARGMASAHALDRNAPDASAKSRTSAALIAAGDPETLAWVSELHARVTALRRVHRLAVRLAIEAHDGRGQRYGEAPYSTHLRHVRRVLKRFSFGPKYSLMGLKLRTAAWLHDIIEDTSVTHAVVAQLVGPEMAEIVFAVTNEPDRPGLDPAERKRLTLEKTARWPESRILKLADRIANVEESRKNLALGREHKLEKYLREWPDFRDALYRPGEADAMWAHLEGLLPKH